MQLMTQRRSRAAVGVAAAAAMAGTAFLAAPAAAAADPADDFHCHITDDQVSVLGVYCYDDVANQEATYWDYQWERDGVAVPGATSNLYEYQASDMGHLFSATVGVDRDGTKVTIPIGRADAPQHQAAYLMEGCNVTVSDKFGNNPGGPGLLDGVHLNDTLTLEVSPAIASNLTVEGPYWSMTTASYGSYILPPSLADQAEGWTVTISDLASIDAILGELEFADIGRRNPIGLEKRGQVEVRNRFVVSGGDVSAEITTCPWGPDTPSGQLDEGVFNGFPVRFKHTPGFPIAYHSADDAGVQGTLTASPGGWNPTGVSDATTFTYQWTRDGQFIAGATSSSYTLTAEDSGRKIGLIVWGTLHETTVWVWGEVFAGDIEAPASGGATTSPTAPATASPSTAADPEQTGTVARGAAAGDTKAPSALASTGSTVLPVLGVAILLLAAGAVVLVVRRRAHQLG